MTCCECRKGEHDNYDEDVVLTVVRDPETNKVALRGYLCANHREAFAMDGYDLFEKGKRP
jgi:hypothetical protein